MIVMPSLVMSLFWDIEMATPVVGKLGRLIPRIYPSISIGTDVSDDAIEEELRLAVPMNPVTVDFSHHEATSIWMRRISDFNEEMGMELATSLFHFSLKCSVGAGMIGCWLSAEGGSGTGGGSVEYP